VIRRIIANSMNSIHFFLELGSFTRGGLASLSLFEPSEILVISSAIILHLIKSFLFINLPSSWFVYVIDNLFVCAGTFEKIFNNSWLYYSSNNRPWPLKYHLFKYLSWKRISLVMRSFGLLSVELSSLIMSPWFSFVNLQLF